MRVRTFGVGLVTGVALGAAAVVVLVGTRPGQQLSPSSPQPIAPTTSLAVASPAPSLRAGDAGRGERMWNTLGCGDCHDAASGGLNVPPSLALEGDRVRPEWLATYLRRPYRIRYEDDGVRPLLRMPDFELEEDEVAALAAHLMRQHDHARVPPFEPVAKPDLAAGRHVFEQYQCFGCHRIGDRGARFGPDLTHVGSRLTPGYMRALVLDPQRVIPKTPMKNNSLWDEEASALVSYLESLR